MQKSSRVGLSIIFIVLLTIQGAFAQVRISSPYSRYGLGDLQGNPFAKGVALGGLGYGLRDNLTLNMKNPASYTAFDSLSFLCDVGISSTFNQLQTTTNVQDFNNVTTLGYLTFGFPVTRWWGASLGLTPYSHTGYQMIIRDTIEGAGNVTQQYTGTGNINRFHLGSGFKLHRDLSWGFNASFLFGNLNNIKSVYFNDLTYVFDTRITNSIIINDFNFETGIQYHRNLKNNFYINAGLVYQIPFNMTGKKSFLVERFVASATTETTKDTIDYINIEKGNVHIPGGIGGGFVVGKKDIWMAGVDVAWQNWDQYRAFGLKDSIKSNFKASFGFQIIPKHSSVSNYFKKVSYRAGFRYEDTYLNLHTNNISEYAVSVGFGFPFRKTGSSLNIGLEMGQRGTTKDQLIQETFVRAVFGLTIKEFWFYRRKLD